MIVSSISQNQSADSFFRRAVGEIKKQTSGPKSLAFAAAAGALGIGTNFLDRFTTIPPSVLNITSTGFFGSSMLLFLRAAYTGESQSRKDNYDDASYGNHAADFQHYEYMRNAS